MNYRYKRVWSINYGKILYYSLLENTAVQVCKSALYELSVVNGDLQI